MKFDNQLRYAATIISSYKGDIPLHSWLKDFFRAHKQMGSRDRKLLSSLAYSFYRLGHAFKGSRTSSIEEQLLTAFFLCTESSHEILHYFRPGWNEQVFLPQTEKIAFCLQQGIDLHPDRIFPWTASLAAGVDPSAYNLSFLQQPDLFLRIRPGQEQAVIRTLGDQDIEYTFIPPYTVRLPNGTKTETWFTPDKEVVIQDYSSQKTGDFLQLPGLQIPRVWDACAASGGKSLLAYDLNPVIDLTVSDIRDSILRNLHERFRQAGIKKYRAFKADLAGPAGSATAAGGPFDLVVADVPCSGSGTWGRTPEELYFFDSSRIRKYQELQRKIILNLLPAIRPGGFLVYITCSVFREENEEQIAFIQERSALKLERMQLLNGYHQRADTLFAARFTA